MQHHEALPPLREVGVQVVVEAPGGAVGDGLTGHLLENLVDGLEVAHQHAATDVADVDHRKLVQAVDLGQHRQQASSRLAIGRVKDALEAGGHGRHRVAEVGELGRSAHLDHGKDRRHHHSEYRFRKAGSADSVTSR